ncbi:DUF960 domain-containing protein [Enterococcus sp. BWB1-3]|uniref:DUF960 domain-containing protein n=1 Tax=Enterococcus sp. BWB1-3 TaxID=2787713 RepID=UPI0019229343|nr:DUF960 domain-containing protein [Enterococcus sp. BWB1-3]MBL1227670.1 DUF960 domain-containing protein [Enterococcus sp. BWB1-3]
MFKSFDTNRSRYASLGIVTTLPGELIDSIWFIIDRNLKGVIPLTTMLTFDVLSNNDKVTLHFSQEFSDVEMAVDLDFPYSSNYPERVLAVDDGQRETILLPTEIIH